MHPITNTIQHKLHQFCIWAVYEAVAKPLEAEWMLDQQAPACLIHLRQDPLSGLEHNKTLSLKTDKG